MKERIRKVVGYYGITINKLEKSAGLSQGVLGKFISGKTTITLETLSKIHENIPDISMDWLLYGRGEMLFNDLQKSENAAPKMQNGEHQPIKDEVREMMKSMLNEKDSRIADLQDRVKQQKEYIAILTDEHRKELDELLALCRDSNAMLRDGKELFGQIKGSGQSVGFVHTKAEGESVVSKL